MQESREVELRGWLQKKGAVGLVRMHKRRWFCFNTREARGRMVYWESEQQGEPKGELVVTSGCVVQPANGSSPDMLSFELRTPARTYLLRADTLEDYNYWMAGLARFIADRKRDEDFVLLGAEHHSCDYIVIDLNASFDGSSGGALRAGSGGGGSGGSGGGGGGDTEDDSLTDSDAGTLPPEISEMVRRVQVIDSAPRSNGLLSAIAPEDASPLGKATRVIQCLKTILGPPQRHEAGLGIGAVLKNLSEDQIEWLAPLLLALEKDDVTEIILHLAASGSPVLRLTLIALHSSGFMVASFARASVNNLYQITNAERNTLRLSDFFHSHGDEVIVGQPFPVEMVHPFSAAKIETVVVKKVFATAAKPMMLEFRGAGGQTVPPMILTKDGDDLRVDLQVQIMFKVFNALWEVYGYEFKNGQLPYCVTYRVCPFSSTTGVIEVVPRCHSLYDHTWVTFDKHRTISSAIGAFVAGYVLGVRDRHKDNILFALDTLELFHVDFGYVFNSQTKMFDAPRFAIPSHFKAILEETGLWEKSFVENAVIAFRILRQNRDFLMSLASKLFSGTHQSCDAYLQSEGFLTHMNDEDACARIRYLVERGPRSWKRVAKNVFHALGF